MGPDSSGRFSELGSTSTNWYIANWSLQGVLVESPTNPDLVVATGTDQLAIADSNETQWAAHGNTAEFVSTDGGTNWTLHREGANESWSNASALSCGFANRGDASIAEGPGDVVYQVALAVNIGNVSGCSQSVSTTVDSLIGIYLTVSRDNGSTWSDPIPVRAPAVGLSVNHPSVAVDPSDGEVYVGYDEFEPQRGIYLVSSSDGGLNWSRPVQIFDAGEGVSEATQIVVEPSGAVDATWLNYSGREIEFARSTDDGSTFSAATVVTTLPSQAPSSSPDDFFVQALPDLAIDRDNSTPRDGELFLTVDDGVGGNAGSPDVALFRSLDNGTTWSQPVEVNSNTRDEDFQPCVAVGPDGTVYVSWYAENPKNGTYRYVAAVSRDGGTTFDPQFNVSDNDSYPWNSATGLDLDIGDYAGLAADAFGARPIWTDTRSEAGLDCPSWALCWVSDQLFNSSLYTAWIVNDSIGASVPVSLALTGSVPDPGPVAAGPAPVPQDWLVGESLSITAPAAVSAGGAAYRFAYWYGNRSDAPEIDSSARTLNGTVAPGEHLVACYVDGTNSTCHAPGAPGFLRLNVSPANASVEIDGTTVGAVGNGTSLMEAPGVHELNVSAPDFLPWNGTVAISPGNFTALSLALRPANGTLVGFVRPSGARLTVNGTPVPLAWNGGFDLALPPGGYDVEAFGYLDQSYVNPSVIVASDRTTFLNISLLEDPGWINGTVYPGTARLLLNGVPQSTGPGGSFNLLLAPGTYWLNATLSGWETGTSGPIYLLSASSALLNLSLTEELGTVLGYVEPENATVLLGQNPVSSPNGTFQLSLPPGVYLFSASAPGYRTSGWRVDLANGETVLLAMALNASGGWIAGTVVPARAEVAVDGSPVAVGPSGSYNVSASPGAHRVVVSLAGYPTATCDVQVVAGRTAACNVDLLERPGLERAGSSKPALLLLAIGASVAAALAGMVILARGRKRR